MSSKRKSFVLHNQDLEILEILTDKQAGLLFKAIRDYQSDIELNLDETTKIILSPFISQFERDYKKSRCNENHWNWQGGISSENNKLRNCAEYKEWRESVFSRDDYTCQECFSFGGILNAHHKKPWAKYKELRFDVDNGLTLCKSCHIEVHREK